MDNIDEVPFRVGQLAESKSFLKGYRGAWFRCKITNISKRKGRITCFVDFFDYPDDEEKWTQLYQKNIWDVSKFPKERKMELMFRPSFPRVYHENEMLPQATFDTTVLVQDVWKVGDMVDWFCSGCYWSAVITKIFREDKVQVELLQPPMGEGGTYEASSKDLRPSLDWTPEQGWVVPLSNDSEGCLSCARMVQPCKEVKGKTDKYSFLEKSTLTSFPKKSFLDKSAAPMPPSGGSDDSVESSIMKLEELAIKIRWLQGLLKFGSEWSDDLKAYWKLTPGTREKK